MMVTWVTQSKSVSSVVEYGENQVRDKRTFGRMKKWEACGWKKRYLYIHRVQLAGLVPGKRYGKADFNYNILTFFSFILNFKQFGDLL